MKKWFAVLTIAAMMLSLTACGEKNVADVSVDNTAASADWSAAETTAAPSEDIATATTAPVRTEADELSDIRQLFQTVCDARNDNDYDAFTACYTDTDADAVQAEYDAFEGHAKRTQLIVTPLMTVDENTRVVNLLTAITSGTYPNTSSSYGGTTFLVKRTADGWRLSLDQTALSSIDSLSLYPDELRAAISAGRNVTEFNSYWWIHLDRKNYIDAALVTEARFMWQDENGNLCLGLGISNGTDGNRTVKSLAITITDQIHGTVWEGTVTDHINIPAKSNDMIYITIPANEVLTGTAAWTSLNFSINSSHV